MPRYFFHLSDGAGSVIDDEGAEFADREAAFRHGDWCVREVISNAVLEGQPIRLTSYLTVHDSQGKEIGKLIFGDVVKFVPPEDGSATT